MEYVQGPYSAFFDGKGLTQSPIWPHGWRLKDDRTGRTVFLCKRCFKARRPFQVFQAEKGTKGVIDHLDSAHGVDCRNKKPPKRPLDGFVAESETQTVRQAIERHYIRFELAEFRALFLTWMVNDDHAYRTLESPQFQSIVAYLQPSIIKRGYLPTHSTVRLRIKAGFEAGLPAVQKLLESSRSKIHCSLDIWTSRKMVAFVGIHVHFCDATGNYKSVLLALPRQTSVHSGVNIATTLLETLSSFGVDADRIGYFIADNAANSNTCLKDLASSLSFKYNERRVRCAGHVINLIAYAILWGRSKASLEPEGDEEDGEDLSDDEDTTTYRRCFCLSAAT